MKVIRYVVAGLCVLTMSASIAGKTQSFQRLSLMSRIKKLNRCISDITKERERLQRERDQSIEQLHCLKQCPPEQ